MITSRATASAAAEPVIDSKAEPVDAFSIDYDGVLSYDISTLKPIHEFAVYNKKRFRNFIKNQIKKHNPKKAILMIGSARQTYHLDALNDEFNRNGLCFPAFYLLAKDLMDNCLFDPYLLQDSWLGINHGTTYCKAIADPYNSFNLDQKPSLPIYDETKRSLLYAQIHKFATENPGARYFSFFDDNSEIIRSVVQFFKAENGLRLPKGLTLKIYHIESRHTSIAKLEPCVEIKGTGIIDYQWEKHSQDIAFYADRSYSEKDCKEMPKPKNINIEEEINKYNQQIYDLIRKRREAETRRAARLARQRRFEYVNWLKSNIISQINTEILRLSQYEDKVSKEKKELFISANTTINQLIKDERIDSATLLHHDVKKVLTHFSQSNINQSKNPVKDVFRFLLGFFISAFTGFTIWGNKSFRNTFWHTQAKAKVNDLVEKTEEYRYEHRS